MKPQPFSIHTSLKDLFFLFFTSGRGVGSLIVLFIGGLISWFFVGASDWQAPLYVISETMVTEGYVNSSEQTDYLSDEEHVINYFFSFDVEGEVYNGNSFTHRIYFQDGASVQVEYLVADPGIARIEGTRNAPWGSWLLLILILPAIGLWLFIGGLKAVRKSSGLLANAYLTQAWKGRTAPTNMTVNDRPVVRILYTYRVKDVEYECSAQTSDPDDYGDSENIIFTGDPPSYVEFVRNLTKGVRKKIEAELGIDFN